MKKKFPVLVFFCLLSISLTAQDPKTVDVKKLSTTEVQKAKNAIENSGLTPEAAIQLARQRGATEQQIRDMQARFDALSNNQENAKLNIDPVQQAIENADQQQDVEQSTRTAPLNQENQIFGSYLFNSENLSFEPNTNVQVPSDYIIGIGDQIIINVWGNSQQNYQLTVNNNGQVIIPDIGPVFIAGRKFEDAAWKIKSRLFTIYADMNIDKPKTFAQINIGQLRSIKVNLVGEVIKPGTYTLKATSSVFNALYLSGGPNSIGSFRNIQIIRDNKIFKTVDIYKFLINADISDNIQLKDEDIIFIPTAEKKISVFGEFKRNATFELKEDENLSDLLKFAGGFTDDSYLFSLQIQRKTQQGKRLIDIGIDEIKNTNLNNGDLLTNKSIMDVYENRVSIQGAVYRPGDYEWHENMMLSNLIRKADSITPDAYAKRGLILRFNEDLSQSSIAFDLSKVLSGETDIELMREDVITIKSQFDLKEAETIRVNGEVNSPGTITFMENMTVRDAIFLSNGLKESADSAFIEVARRLSHKESAELTDKLVHIHTIAVPRSLNMDDPQFDFALQAFDQLNIRRAPGYQEQANVYVSGEVKYAGSFALQNRRMRISNLIEYAGGLTKHAYIKGARLERTSNELGTEQIGIELQKIIASPGQNGDLFLKPDDRLIIPTITQTVKVTGSVQNPFSLSFKKGKSFKHYIKQSGGFTDDAHKKKAYVKYADGSTDVTKRFITRTYPKVEPGSIIIVPQKPEKQRIDNSGKWMAWSSVLASLAVAIATIFK